MLDLVTAALDWLGIVAFATTGALVASRKEMDLVGFALLGIVTGVGGGTMRDLLLGVPVFWVGRPAYLITCVLVSVLVFFTAHIGWFPVQGWSDSLWKNLAIYAPLPVLLAVLVSLGPTIRLYRSVFLDEMNHDYVRTARAKGLSEGSVMFKHVLRNAMIPILTNIGIALPGLILGSFLIEKFFSIPGLGREVITAVERSDFPVIKAITVYLAFATMLFNLLTDVLYKWVDPRVEFK